MRGEWEGKKKKGLIRPPEALIIHRRRPSGQVILEFTFCMIVVLLMIYGVAKVFIWTGKDLVERRKAHDNVLFGGGTPLQQVAPDFYTPISMNAVWGE